MQMFRAEHGAGPESGQGKKLVITDEYFQRVTRALVMRLRQHEETLTQEGESHAGLKDREQIYKQRILCFYFICSVFKFPNSHECQVFCNDM